MANKYIDLFKEIIPAFDLNLKDLWDAVDDDSRKEIKGDMFNLNRYISSVKGQPRHVQEHFLITVNEYYNKNWAVLQQHPKLLWLLLCMCSYDGPEAYNKKGEKVTFFHEWIPSKRKTKDKKSAFLSELYPHYKDDEIELLAAMMTDKEFKQLAKDHGMDDAEIAKKLKK